MKLTATQDLYRIWTALRGARPAPDRAEIDPAQLVSVLPYVFLLETFDDSWHHVRLAGTHVCAAFDAELRGKLFGALWQREDQTIINDLIETVGSENAAVVLGATGAVRDMMAVHAELLLLPLRTMRPGVHGIIGSCVVRSDSGLINRPVCQLALTTQRVSWPSGRRTSWPETREPSPIVHVGARRQGRFLVYEGGRN